MNDKLEIFNESVRETIDEAIRTYKQEVEKMKRTYM